MQLFNLRSVDCADAVGGGATWQEKALDLQDDAGHECLLNPHELQGTPEERHSHAQDRNAPHEALNAMHLIPSPAVTAAAAATAELASTTSNGNVHLSAGGRQAHRSGAGLSLPDQQLGAKSARSRVSGLRSAYAAVVPPEQVNAGSVPLCLPHDADLEAHGAAGVLPSSSSSSLPSSASASFSPSASEGSAAAPLATTRALVWRCYRNVLDLQDISSGGPLLDACLQLRFPFAIVGQRPAIIETATSVCVFVVTRYTAHRLVFPHPSLPLTEQQLELAAKLRAQLHTICVSVAQLYGANASAVLGPTESMQQRDVNSNSSLSFLARVDARELCANRHHVAVATRGAVPSSISAVSETTLTVGCEDGRMLLLRFPDATPRQSSYAGLGSHTYEETVLQQAAASVMQRLWSGLAVFSSAALGPSTTPRQRRSFSSRNAAERALTRVVACQTLLPAMSADRLKQGQRSRQSRFDAMQSDDNQDDDEPLGTEEDVDTTVAVLHADARLRMWQTGSLVHECVADVDLVEFLSLGHGAIARDATGPSAASITRERIAAAATSSKHLLRVAFLSETTFRLAVYLSIGELSQLLLFDGTLATSTADLPVQLAHIATKFVSAHGSLLDMSLTATSLWTLWRTVHADGGADTSMARVAPLHSGMQGLVFGEWIELPLSHDYIGLDATPLPLAVVPGPSAATFANSSLVQMIASNADPTPSGSRPQLTASHIRDVFIARIFAAGRFSRTVLRAAISSFAAALRIPADPLAASAPIARFHVAAEHAVDSEIRESLAVSGRDSPSESELAQATMASWARLYSCCLGCASHANVALGLFCDTSSDVFGVVRLDGVSLIRSVAALERVHVERETLFGAAKSSSTPSASPILTPSAPLVSACASLLLATQPAVSAEPNHKRPVLSASEQADSRSDLASLANNVEPIEMARLLLCMSLVSGETNATIDDLLLDPQDPWTAVAARLAPVFDSAPSLHRHRYPHWSKNELLSQLRTGAVAALVDGQFDELVSGSATATFPIRFSSQFKPLRCKVAVIARLLLALQPEQYDNEAFSPAQSEWNAIAPWPASLVAAAFQQTVTARLALCFDLLLLFGVLTRLRGTTCLTNKELSQCMSTLLPECIALVKKYMILYWISLQRPVPSVSAESVSTSSKTMLALLGEDRRQHTAARLQNADALVHLILADSSQSRLNVPLAQVDATVSWLISRLVSTTDSNVQFVASGLQSHGQQGLLMEFVSLLDNPPHSVLFLAGQFFLASNQPAAAKEYFTKASVGIRDGNSALFAVINDAESESLMNSIAFTDSEKQTSFALVTYYLHVVRLFDRRAATAQALEFATIALGLASDQDPRKSSLWSNIFKFCLDLAPQDSSLYMKAYAAMIANQDRKACLDCLLRFIVVLSERQEIDLLCRMPYTGLESDVESALLLKAHNMNVVAASPNYYEILYSFHVFRSNYRSAALAMYEFAQRLGSEVAPKEMVHWCDLQARCYLAAVNALRLVKPENAWLRVPSSSSVQESNQAMIQGSFSSPKRKRTASALQDEALSDETRIEEDHGDSRCVIVELDDISREHLLVTARWRLLQHNPELATAMAGISPSPNTVFSLLLQTGFYDTAVALATKFSINLVPLFESLASRCANLAAASTKPSQLTSHKLVEWLQHNILSLVSRDATDSAWRLLQSYLDAFDSADTNYEYHRAVVHRLLAIDRRIKLPQWLIMSAKSKHPVDLIQVFLKFALLEDAAGVALYYINAMKRFADEISVPQSDDTVAALRPAFLPPQTVGQGKLTERLPFATWLPVNVFDQLLAALRDASTTTSSTRAGRSTATPSESQLHSLAAQLTKALAEYNRSLEQHAQALSLRSHTSVVPMRS
ncbi:nucleoporin [Capsaspora owczarzaki ATCC 30864]|uniref:Nucleoporin n=1 Tax=Capsaspora owczarzaki (strain ATCC 30864) TaxID=595528 RepID=A0A0D2X0I9_CAPO3|nr:nucleoporin [Capsaspora owczarzaki ATCC 30864]KJE89139.1 nucleoporin [Capsaspora owczarzaki ATCC 30864]|eukprot:XP_004365543.1 nucleoporin [Capsaspora owczarzaki ATCC 30864]